MAQQRNLLNDLSDLAQLQPDAAHADRAIDRAHAALRVLPAEPPARPLAPYSWKRQLWRPRNLIAAAATVLAILFASQWLSTQSGSNIAFAQVQEQIAKTRTVQFRTISNRTIGTNVLPEALIKTMILGTHLKREELTLKDPGKLEEARKWGVVPNITIHNVATGQLLILQPEEKLYSSPQNFGFFVPQGEKLSQKEIDAAKAHTEKWLKDPQVDFFNEIRHFPENKATKLPEQIIDGKQTVGFQIEQKQDDQSHHVTSRTTYWIDTETKLPVRIEYLRTDNAELGLGFNTVMKDFVFDAPLDESLFSFTPPADYTELGKAMANNGEPKTSGQNTMGPASKKTEFVFADVQDEVAKTKSVQFIQSDKAIANDEITYEGSGQMSILGANLSREEVRVKRQPKSEEPLRRSHFIHITNSKTKTSLCLYPEEKEYSLIVSRSMVPGRDLYRMFHDVPAERIKKLPEKVLNGKHVVGFVLEDTVDHPDDKTEWAETTTYWIDVTTKLPVRIEYTGRNKNPDAHESYETIRSDFVFDAPLDESLFSTEAPQGWMDVSQRFEVPIK
jgi:hypothetical protein